LAATRADDSLMCDVQIGDSNECFCRKFPKYGGKGTRTL